MAGGTRKHGRTCGKHGNAGRRGSGEGGGGTKEAVRLGAEEMGLVREVDTTTGRGGGAQREVSKSGKVRPSRSCVFA